MPAPPDDIKIIAQFLAGRMSDRPEWEAMTRDALRLKRELNQRGAYRIVRTGKPA
jgi:hypothetical protein